MNESHKTSWFSRNWFKVTFLLILVLSLAGSFYWFGWRPTEIKKACAVDRDFKAGEMEKNIETKKIDLTIDARDYLDEVLEKRYNNCLRQSGL